jgi:xanthine dehydrogenase YagR molybdenum-binding subunit
VPLNVGVPAPMRGPGEATGLSRWNLPWMSYLTNSISTLLNCGLKNYTDTDPERNLPWSSKYLKECYQKGAEAIGWSETKSTTRYQ